jgi:hypothetical protein
MYELTSAGPARHAIRERHMDLANDFGEFAVASAHPGSTALSVSGPVPSEYGTTVTSRFYDPSDGVPTSKGAECLLTMKPDPGMQLKTAQVLNVLAKELSDFAGNQLLTSSAAETLKSLKVVSAQPSNLEINAVSVAGWRLETLGVLGIVVGYRDRFIMWLGAGRHDGPPLVLTEDFGSQLRELRCQ